jgi:hypothetical protein
VGRNGVEHQDRERGALLRLDERDVLNAGLMPRPRLDRLAGWRFKPKRVVRDRLIDRRQEGRDLVKRLPVSDRGDAAGWRAR